MIKNLLKWVLALAAAYLLVNIILIPYYHYTPGIPLSVNATNEIYYPDSVFLTTGEGYRMDKFDENGYLNKRAADYSDSYVLVMGSSHTMGKEVPTGNNYCELLHKQYGFPVYNMGMDGHLYPDIVAGFSAALKQFPSAQAVVIETGSTKFDLEVLRASLTQRPYDPASCGEMITSSFGWPEQIKSLLQTWFPYRILLKQKIKALNAEQEEVNTGDTAQYTQALSDTMSLMREVYDKPIIIMYHPPVEVDHEGRVSTRVDDEITRDIFENACRLNDIEFVDMSDEFIMEYETENRLPHGFMNTSMGTGHLNRTGHRLIAEKLAAILEQYNEQ